MKTAIDTYFEGIADTYTKMFPLAAIWMPLTYNVVRKGNIEETRRITNGDQITLIQGILCSCNDGKPTHEIVKLFGTLQDSKHELECINLSTGLTETIKLK